MATVNRPRGRPVVDPGVQHLCALVAVRELDRREADAEAMAAFEGRDFEPSIPEGLRWRDWCDLRGEALARTLRERVLPALSRLPDRGDAALFKRLAPMLGEVADRLPRNIVDDQMGTVTAMDLESPGGRSRALGELTYAVLSATLPEGHEETAFGVLARDLLAGPPGARVFDPWVRDGSLLVFATRSTEACRVAGVAVSANAYAVALARLLLHGVREIALEVGNVMNEAVPSEREGRFDRIVAVPPSGALLDGAANATLPVTAASREMAALVRVALSLRSGGHALVALPPSALARGGRDAAVRRWLLTQYRVEAVITTAGLSRDLLDTVAMPLDLVLFSRDLPAPDVTFVALSDVIAPLAQLWTNDVAPPPLEEALRDALRDPAKTAQRWSVPVVDLLERDAVLHLTRRRWEEGQLAWRTLLTRLAAHPERCAVVQLRELASVSAGSSANVGDVRTEPGPGRLPYVRIRDVAEGTITPSRRWVEARPTGDVQQHWLRPGDLVLTARGDELRVAVAANGAVGAVADVGLRVIRPTREDVAPDYLRAWLSSAAVRARLAALQTGAVVPTLRVEALASLEVAVPPLAVQARVVRAWRERRVDPVEETLRALAGVEEDGGWLQPFLESDAIRALLAESSERALERVEAALDAIPPPSVTGEARPESDFVWRLRRLAPVLQNSANLPDGALRCAGLLTALVMLRDEVEPHADAVGPALFQKLDPVAKACERLLRSELESVLSGARLVAEGVAAWVVPNERAGARVRLYNAGTVALREVVASALDDSGWRDGEGAPMHGYCAQGASLEFEFQRPHTEGEALPPLTVRWSALAPDGRAVAGEDTLDVAGLVTVRAEAGTTPDLGANPYVVGDPVRDTSMFFGREDILRAIEGQLSAVGRSSVILLEGARRSGKTSIQFQLMRRGRVPGAVIVRSDLQRIEGDERGRLTAARLWRGIARDVFGALREAGLTVLPPGATPLPPGLNPLMAVRKALDGWFQGNAPFEALEGYLDEVFRALAPRRLVVVLDEFDRLAESIDAGALPVAALGQLRAMLQRRTDLCAVLTGTRAMTRLRNEHSSPLFGMGFSVHVGRLAEDDARALVTRPVEGRLAWSEGARDRVVVVCGRQPFMIQSMCARVFQDAEQHQRRFVDTETVERAIEVFAEDHEHLRTLWGYARSSRQRLILGLCANAKGDGESQPLDAAVLEEEFARRRVPLPDDGLGADLEAMIQEDLLELVSQEGYQRYRLTLPLMAAWIRRNQDLSVLARQATDDILEEET